MKPIFRKELFVCLMFAFISFAAHAQKTEKSGFEGSYGNRSAALNTEMLEARVLAQKLRQIANTVDNDQSIGTMYNEVDSKQHICYVLGILLGQDNAVRHLRFNRSPSTRARDSSDAYALRINAQSLENFEYTVKRMLRLTHDERAMEWDLDCLGHMNIRGSSIQTTASRTFYRLREEGTDLQILGDISPGFTANLRSALISNPRVRTVSLGSGGGSVYEAIEAGRLIRKSGLDTRLWNNCFSACPLVFAGGKSRTIWSPYPYLGFHKVYSKKGVAPLNSQVYRDIAAYLTEMGIAPRFVLDNMARAEPSEMNMIKASQQLCDSGFVTWIQRLC